jgi:hypothetical protein
MSADQILQEIQDCLQILNSKSASKLSSQIQKLGGSKVLLDKRPLPYSGTDQTCFNSISNSMKTYEKLFAPERRFDKKSQSSNFRGHRKLHKVSNCIGTEQYDSKFGSSDLDSSVQAPEPRRHDQDGDESKGYEDENMSLNVEAKLKVCQRLMELQKHLLRLRENLNYS